MSATVVDAFTTPWTPDASGLWTVVSTPSAAHHGTDGLGMDIKSTAGATAAPTPSARRHFAPALDLRDRAELRFWLRSSRSGDGSTASPIYLMVEATTDPPGAIWQRLLQVPKANTWQLVVLWLGDMSPALRQAVGFIDLRSLDGRVAFTASVDDLIATTADPIANAEAALVERLDGRWSVDVAGVETPVPAFVDLPEAPPGANAPYILITPWEVTPSGSPGGQLDVVDNATTTGAYVRPSPALVELSYRVDVWAQDRAQKTLLLDRLVRDLLQPLIVDDVEYRLDPVRPSDEERAKLIAPGRTPLFYRVLLPIEVGARSFREQADPFLLVGDINQRNGAEAVQL